MDVEFLKMLNAREQRWEMRKQLVKKRGRCLISITLCLPLKYRIDKEFLIIFQNFCNIFLENFISSEYNVSFEGSSQSEDGPVFFISIEGSALEIKKICVKAEETFPGGRMLDIDVMDKFGVPISRKDIDLPPRRCFICENPASLCASRKTHSPEDIFAYVQMLKNELRIDFTTNV